MSMRTDFFVLLLVAMAAAGVEQPAGAMEPLPGPMVGSSNVTVQLNDLGQGPRMALFEGVPANGWLNRAEEPLPASVEVGGVQRPLKWTRRRELERASRQSAALVYESESPRLRLSWEWEARAAAGAVEHRVRIENLGAEQVWLPMVDSLRLDVAAGPELRNLYVEKGADTPSEEGTHLDAVAEGYRWTGRSSTYAIPWKGEAHEIIPAVAVFEAGGERRGWYAGLEFSGRVRIKLERSQGRLQAVLGLNPEPGPFRTRLAPGESFETPTVFLGVFTGGVDGAGNQLRPWVRAALGNPHTWQDEHYPYTVNNSWGSGMQVDEPLALKMIADSRELGLEMFHVDAGWFRGVGDWQPDAKKFPHGLAAIADAAHAAGLRFGIWTDWTQAALSSEPGALNARDATVKDWMVSERGPEWKPEGFKGQTVDLGVPAAERWAAGTLERMVRDFKLDMLEHDGYLVAQGCVRPDHPHAPAEQSSMRIRHDGPWDFVEASNSTDVSYHAARAYYRVYEQLRREHPGLIFEVCNDGGRMVDFGSAAHGDYFSITDTYDPLSNRRAFYDASHLLPPAMLESYVESWPTPSLANFRYMLRSGMMGWVSIMQDTTQWSEQQHRAAREEIARYKEKLRPLIRAGELFHVSARPDGVHWDGLEYWDTSARRGVVYAFRGSVADEAEHRFVLAGLEAGRRYRLHFEDGSAADAVRSGRELMETGLGVRLGEPLSSELVFLEEVR